MPDVVLRIFRGNRHSGETPHYPLPLAPGMVLLDAITTRKDISPDLAVREL
jgi:hypothetical protein